MIILFKNKVSILLLLVGIVMIAGGLLVTYKTKKAFDTSAFWTEHTHEVIVETQNVLSVIQDIQLGGRGYVITADNAFLEPVNRSAALALTAIQRLRTLTRDNANQKVRIDSIDYITRFIMGDVSRYMAIRRDSGLLRASTVVSHGNGRMYLKSIRHLINQIEKEEYKLLRLRKDANKKSTIILYRIFIFLLLGQAFFLVIIFFTVKHNIEINKKNDSSEIRFRSTLDNMLEGVEILGFDFRYLYVNDAYVKQVKYTKEELLGYTIMEKFTGIEKTGIFNAIQQCFDERVAIHREENFTFSDNTNRWFEISLQPVPEGVFIHSVDITDKRHAAEKIRQSEERFRSLIENSYDIVSIIDKDFKPLYRSPASIRITGWANEDVAMKGSIDQTHPDDITMLKSTLVEVLNSPGVPFPISFRTRHKTGHYLFLEGMITNMFHNESIKGIVSNFRDVTETRKAEADIKRSELRFRALIENSYDIVSVLDESFRPLYRSPSSVRITGYTNEERDMIGGGNQQVHPDDVERVTSKMKEVLASPGLPIPLRFRVKHKEGHYILIDGIITNMINDELIQGIVSNFRDITEIQKAEMKLRESEKIYKTIASNIPGSVICLFDRDFRYLLIEGDMLELLGYSKEKLLGNKVIDVIPAERYAELLPQFNRVFGGESFKVENSRLDFDTLSIFVPLRDEDNNVFAAMVVVFDVSELKQAQRGIAALNVGLEHKIKERTTELETVNKELEAFSYSVAHDLRSPLRAINGYATMLEEDYSEQFDDEGRRLLDTIGLNVKRMGTLIDDLLKFSRLGRTEIEKSLVDMTQLAESSLQEINLEKGYDGEINIHMLHAVMADFSLMKHVMINLLSNAVKYSSKNENPVIEITSHLQNEEVIYSIKDNGVGFDMKYADKLFGVFQRLHSDKEFAGTGVGLAIVERIIHRHGGKIWAEGVVNQGAIFYFSLPVIPDKHTK